MWPHEKRFAFTVFDDTDNDVISNTIAVYDLLAECNMRTSKSVWIYPPRDGFRGLGLLDSDYEQYIMGLCAKGFEICLHSVGSGSFSRKEITYGLDVFRDTFGSYPRVHANQRLSRSLWKLTAVTTDTIHSFYSLAGFPSGE